MVRYMPKNTRADETILSPAASKGVSLRAIVPAFIISQFELRKGDALRWKIKGKYLRVEIVKNNGFIEED
jgi:hypothetical protein